MKIAYVTDKDPEDVKAWSGLVYYIRKSLEQAGLGVTSFGNIESENYELLKLKRKIYRRISKKKYLSDRSPLVLRSYANKIGQLLEGSDHDVVFSPSSIIISDLKTQSPIVFWTDATFAGMMNFYDTFSNLNRETIRNGHRQEQRALNNCSLAIYSSEWAAKSAIDHYEVDPSKVKIVPFGANLECNRTLEEILALVDEKMDFDPIRLLFIGKDWQRKGGPKALEVVKLLSHRGLHAQLHIAGCIPPIALPAFVKVHGFISKQTIEGRTQLDDLFTKSHFFLLPSEAEAFGIVFAEASSFGLPSLASDVGGIPSAVRDNINGQTFTLDSDAYNYCDYILQLVNSKERYRSLAISSYQEYTHRLNWSVAGETIKNLITEHCL